MNEYRISITLSCGETREFKVKNPWGLQAFAAGLRNQLMLDLYFMISCEDTPLNISIFNSRDVANVDVLFHRHVKDDDDGANETG